ncbi:MAG: hypothetical protein ACRELV_09310 [Longimicrobiales bacterium]
MATRRARLGAMLTLALAASLQAGPAMAQRAGAAVDPDTVTVGTIFHVAVRVVAPAAAAVEFPDSLAVAGDVAVAGRREILLDTLNGELSWTAIYPLAAWRPGSQPLPRVRVGLTDRAGTRTATLELPPVFVASVLPADTAGIDPQPPKGVVGGDGFPWLRAGLLLLALLLLLLLVYLWRRWKASRAVALPAAVLSPRERALAEIAALRDTGPGMVGDWPLLYTRLSEVVRRYLVSIHPGLGFDLTTLELMARARGVIEPAAAEPLVRFLLDADLVKFARATPGRDRADADLARAAAWVRSYPPAPPVAEERVA